MPLGSYYLNSFTNFCLIFREKIGYIDRILQLLKLLSKYRTKLGYIFGVNPKFCIVYYIEMLAYELM